MTGSFSAGSAGSEKREERVRWGETKSRTRLAAKKGLAAGAPKKNAPSLSPAYTPFPTQNHHAPGLAGAFFGRVERRRPPSCGEGRGEVSSKKKTSAHRKTKKRGAAGVEPVSPRTPLRQAHMRRPVVTTRTSSVDISSADRLASVIASPGRKKGGVAPVGSKKTRGNGARYPGRPSHACSTRWSEVGWRRWGGLGSGRHPFFLANQRGFRKKQTEGELGGDEKQKTTSTAVLTPRGTHGAARQPPNKGAAPASTTPDRSSNTTTPTLARRRHPLHRRAPRAWRRGRGPAAPRRDRRRRPRPGV